MLNFEKYYHIFNHANGDENLFREQKNYVFFLEKHRHHIDPIADTLAWCLMPNHFHLLIKVKDEEEIFSAFPKFRTLEKHDNKINFLSKQFANFFSSYTQSFNKVYGRRGSLFLKNFKRKEIRDENHLRMIVFYIHLNPVHHGFTEALEQWKWTSYKDFPIEQPEILRLLFDNKANYKLTHLNRQNHFEGYSELENELT